MSLIAGRRRDAVLVLLFGLVAAPACAHEFTFKSLQILHPYTLEPEVQLPKTLPLYMTIRNTGRQTDRLLAVECPMAATATIARTADPGAPSQTDGIMLPAESEVKFRPTGPFILLHDLKQSLEGYQYFPITLNFEIAGKMEIEVLVEER